MYYCTSIEQELVGAAAQMLGRCCVCNVDSPGGSTVLCEMTSWLPSGNYDDQVWLHQLMSIYLKNIPAFPTDVCMDFQPWQRSVFSECCPTFVALMESVRSLDASSLPLNRDQFLDLASSLNEFFLQNGLIKAEPSSSTNFQQMVPQSQMPIHPATFPQELSPHIYQNYPVSNDQTPSPGKSAAFGTIMKWHQQLFLWIQLLKAE